MTNDPNVTVVGLDDIEVKNTPLDDLNSARVNLICVAIDGSDSMTPFGTPMRESLADFKTALSGSKEADEILVSRIDFHNRKPTGITVSGYKNIAQFDQLYHSSGMTPLYDVIIDGAEELLKYMKFLKDNGMNVKAVFAVFSDGDDTSSFTRLVDAKAAVATLNAQEVTTAFICFGHDAPAVQKVAEDLGFRNILVAGATADRDQAASELRHAFNCLSRSVISASKAVAPKTDDFFVV